MSVIIGVDPGASGALALVIDGRLTEVCDMPAADGVVSGTILADRIGDMLVGLWQGTPEAIVEKVGSMPGQGVSSTFKFGRSVGCIDGVLGALRIPFDYVTPQRWKASNGLSGQDKDASRHLAARLWPDHSAAFARKKDDGRAEAALIARHLWLLRNGGRS